MPRIPMRCSGNIRRLLSLRLGASVVGALIGVTMVVSTYKTVLAQDRFDITAWIYWGEEHPVTGVPPPYVSENERAILKALGFTRLTTTKTDRPYLDMCNASGGEIRMVFAGMHEDSCHRLCWSDSSSCTMTNFCGRNTIADVVFTCHQSSTDPLWYQVADSVMTDVIEYWGDQPGIDGYSLVDEVYDIPCRTAMEHMAAYLQEHKSNPRYSVSMSGANVWTAMEEHLFDDLTSVDYWEIFDYPFVLTWHVPYAGGNYQHTWDVSINSYDTVLSELKWRGKPYALGVTCDGDTIGDASGTIYRERMPTPAELRCQIYIALSRAAKGIAYFRLDNGAPWVTSFWGNMLVSGSPRVKYFTTIPAYPNGGYFIFDTVAVVNSELKKLGPYMLNLYADTGFTSSDATRPETVVDSVTGNYFEVGVMTDIVDEIGRQYFVIVNRDCNTSTGAPAPDRSSTVYLNVNTPNADSALRVIDLLKDDTVLAYACDGRYVLRLTFAPGSGYVFKIGDVVSETPGPDNDADGITDGCDNCPNFANADQTDADGDGVGDLCDPCANDFWNDRDGDGICGDVDPCPLDSLNDVDGDGICGNLDNCPNASNVSQVDSDDDGFGDACDNCPGGKYVSVADRDGDGVGDCCDNCPDLSNPLQQVIDNDTDLVIDCRDNCPGVHNPAQADYDHNSLGDGCDYQIAASVSDTMVLAGSSLIWPIYLSNDVPVSEIKVTAAVTDAPDLVLLDSINTDGCRTAYFEYQQLVFSTGSNGKLAYLMKSNVGGGAPLLVPGNGAVAKLYLRIPASTPDATQITLSAPTLGAQGTHYYTVKGVDATLPNTFPPATLTVNNPCACDCHGDPGGPCDGLPDILDVTFAVNVAFRNVSPVVDPNCPNERTDVNCDGFTDILDVVLMVSVAFRNGNPATEFCNPCP